MTATERELDEAYWRAIRLPQGAVRSAAIDVVLRQADASGLESFAFHKRLDAIERYRESGDPTRAFLAFSWCLARMDQRPELATRGDAEALMWRYKWVAADLVEFPEVPLAQTNAALDDMQRRYQLAGYSLHPIYEQRWENADHVGDPAAAQHWYELMLTAKRDSMSNCRACVPTSQVYYHTSRGEYERAVEVAQPGLGGGCAHQPQRILTALLVPLLRVGQHERAVGAHREAYSRMQSSREYLYSVANHIEFCALTGNEARGLELIERHQSWLAPPAVPGSVMRFAASAALVLRRLAETGRGELTIEHIAPDPTAREELPVTALHDRYAAQARAIAARFDERNGTAHQSRLIEQVMAQSPLVERLPLTLLAGRRLGKKGRRGPAVTKALARVGELTAAGDAAGAARAKLALALALRDASVPDDALETAEEARRALRRAGLAAEHAQCLYLLFQLYSHRYDSRDDAFAVVEELLAALEPGPLPAVPALPALLQAAADALPGLRALRWREQAASRYRSAGDVAGERDALRAAVREAIGTDTARGVELLARLDEVGPGALLTEAQVRAEGEAGSWAGQLLFAAGRPADALARLGAAIARLEAAGASDWALHARTWRARALLSLDRPAEAEEEARHVIASEGEDRYFWNARVAVVRALQAQGRAEDAAAFCAGQDIRIEYAQFDDDY